MDRSLARILVSVGFRSSRELNDLLHLLKAQCGDDEYQRLKAPIASAIAEVTAATFEPAFAAHPDLRREVDDQINKCGRFD